jgi:hypothetical protein
LNAHISIRDNLDPVSNVTEEGDFHKEKHSLPKTSTDAGRIISTIPALENAPNAIRNDLDRDSNLTKESDPHKKSTPVPKTEHRQES